MKKTFLKLMIGCLALLPLASCSDFLDNQPENIKTIEEVFSRRQSSLEFLANVYSYIRYPYSWSNQSLWTGVSDELDVTYPDYEISKINLGMLAPDKEAEFYGNMWAHYYPGIRAATFFMQHIDANIEMSADEIWKSKAEARALRAWFYFCLVRQYGPVVLMSEDLIDADAPVSEMQLPRSSAKECFDYIVGECDAVLDMDALADVRDTQLNYGRITNATVQAIKARALLYAASPLYNNDETLPVFKEFRNIDGSLMMDYTNADATQRWQAAADACKELFSKYSQLQLYDEGDPYLTYKNIHMVDWNSEWIWARPACDLWEQHSASVPRFANGWSGWGVTQEMVDAFFTKTGYPVLNDGAGRYYSEDGSYSEEGFSTAAGDDGHTQRGTFKMYCNREPRFYVAIAFDNMKWISKYNDGTCQFYYGGNTGRTPNEERNYSQTGYLTPKYVDPESDTNNGRRVEHAGMLLRLGEFYLNYAEALNEVSYEQNRAEILQYVNAIRTRAGIPAYGNGVPAPKSQEEMRESIRRERRVELCFEEVRYFDCCRWCIAHKEFSGPKHGMNANDARGKDVFYQRTVFENRVFNDYATLWPIPMTETYKDKNLVQNPEWSSISSSNMDDL